MRVALVLLLLAGCAQDSEPAAEAPAPAPEAATSTRATPAAPTLTAQGYDTIRIGAPPAAATGYALADDGSYEEDCRIFTSPRLPGVYLIVEGGRVMRITAHAEGGASASTLRTDRGIGVGSTEQEVRSAYSPLREEPHDYLSPQGKNLYFGGSETEPGLRFEMGEDDRVSHVHAGLDPVLAYSEGCS